MMRLRLNLPSEHPERYQAYEGRPIERMPILLRDGRLPISVAQLMQRRLAVLNSNDHEPCYAWWHDIDTGDGARRHPDGRLKIAYDSATLRAINKSSRVENGMLILTPEEYASGDGPEFTPEQVRRNDTNAHFSVAHAMKNPIYVEGLARGDKTLAREYAAAVFLLNRKFTTKRCVWSHLLSVVPPDTGHCPAEELWHANPGGYRRADCNTCSIDFYRGCLIGVLPER